MKQYLKILAAAAMVFLYTGCGRSSSSDSYNSYAISESYDGGSGVASYYDSYAAEEAAYDYEAKTAETTSGTEAPAITGEKLVYHGAVTIETLGYEDTVNAVKERIKAYNGIIQDQNEWDGDNSWYYTDGRGRTTNRSMSMTVRIPTKDFDSFMNDMEGTGKIASRSMNVENISRQYSDNEIEIEALEKQQERLLQMMDAADTVEEMIMVEERLSEVQTQLNQKKSRKSTMDTDVEYSTIYLNVKEVQKYTPQDDGIQISGFWERVKETAEYSWTYFVWFLQNLVLLLIRILPVAAVIGIIIFIWKRIRKAKGLDTKIFHKKPKEERDWKKYTEERKAQLAAKNEAKKLDDELKNQ